MDERVVAYHMIHLLQIAEHLLIYMRQTKETSLVRGIGGHCIRSRSVSGPRGRNSWQDSCGLQLDPLSMVQGREGRCGGLGT